MFTNCVLSNHWLSLDCVAASVAKCQIYASSDLTGWRLIFSTNLSASPSAAAPFQFRYGDAPSLPARFYRLSQTPGF
jgi:hypothetical protein